MNEADVRLDELNRLAGWMQSTGQSIRRMSSVHEWNISSIDLQVYILNRITELSQEKQQPLDSIGE